MIDRRVILFWGALGSIFGVSLALLPSLKRLSEDIQMKNSASTQAHAETAIRRGGGELHDGFRAAIATHDRRSAVRWLRQEMTNYQNSDFRQTLDLLVSRQLGGVQIALFEELFQQWGESDPEAAIAKAAELPPHLRGRAMLNVMDSWLRGDTSAARGWLKSLPYDGMKEELIYELCKKLGGEDLKGMMALVDENELPDSRIIKSTLLFFGAGNDPEYAIAYALRHSNRELKGNALSTAVWYLMQSKPEAFEHYLEAEEGASNRRSLLKGLLAYYSSESPEKGLELFANEWTLLSQIEWDNSSSNTLFSTLNKAFDKDPDKMLKWLEGQPEGDLKGQTLGNIIINLSTEQRHKLMNSFTEDDLLKESNSGTLAALVSYSLKEDFSGALRWISENSDRLNFETHDSIFMYFSYKFESLSFDSYSKASQLAASFKNDKAVRVFAERMAGSWSGQEPGMLDSLLKESPEGLFRDSLLNGVFKTAFFSNPADGIARVEELTPGPMKDRLTIVGLRNAERDFETLVPWAAKGPETAALNNGLAEAIRRWSAYDAQAASQWVASLPTGARRDVTAGSLARSIAVNDPTNAIEWARSIQDEKGRAATLESVLTAWKRFDEKAASDWIKGSNLPEDSKTKILQK